MEEEKKKQKRRKPSGPAYRSVHTTTHLKRVELDGLIKGLGLKNSDFADETQIDANWEKGFQTIFQTRIVDVEERLLINEERATQAKELGIEQFRDDGYANTGYPIFGKFGMQNVIAPDMIPWLLRNGYVPITMVLVRAKNERDEDGKFVSDDCSLRIRWVLWNDENDKLGEDPSLESKIGIITRDHKKVPLMVRTIERYTRLNRAVAYTNVHAWDNSLTGGGLCLDFTPMQKGVAKKFQVLAFNADGTLRGEDIVKIYRADVEEYTGRRIPGPRRSKSVLYSEAVEQYGKRFVREHGEMLYKMAPVVANPKHRDYMAPAPRPSLLADLNAKLGAPKRDTPAPDAG